MNKFATIVPAIRFRKVTYYSVQIEEEQESLFMNFANKHIGERYDEQMAIIRFWLKKIGEEIGAKEYYFRPEGFRGGDARALPPSAKIIDVECNLRLYCMRINDEIVILFNGAEKTANTAQNCPLVLPHFLQANKLTRVIDQAFKDRDIEIDDNDGTLIYNEHLTLEL